MNRFLKPDWKKRILDPIRLSILLFAIIIVLFIVGISTVSGRSIKNESDILNDALLRDIIHCYSIEGMYPPSLDYIEAHYGLTYDHDRYVIEYEPVGSNLMPNFKIIDLN